MLVYLPPSLPHSLFEQDTQYENFLISKIFLFQIVNSFAALGYIAFVKSFLNFVCTQDSCSSDVSSTLATIFLSSLLSRALLQVLTTSPDSPNPALNLTDLTIGLCEVLPAGTEGEERDLR